MKKFLPVAIFLLVTYAFSNAQKGDEKLIKQMFGKYRDAMLSKKAEEAASYLGSRTLKYYTDLLVHLKSDDSVKLCERPIFDRIIILTTRAKTDKEKILSFDGKSFMIYALEQEMNGKNSFVNASITDLQVLNDEFAKAQLILNDKPVDFFYNFDKEEGQWKLDISSLFASLSRSFKNVLKNNKKTETEFVLEFVELINAEKPGPGVWKPVE